MNITDTIISNEGTIRLSVFAGIFIIMALWEFALPRRPLIAGRTRRWSVNWFLIILDGMMVRFLVVHLLVPIAAVGAAIDASAQGWGLFNILEWPIWLELIISIVILDLVIYAQHVASHKIPIIWRVHRVHHSDRDIDVTTAIRFHPIEILLSLVLKVGVIYLLGPAVVAVIIFEVILNGSAMFNHSNIKLPLGLDRVLRWLIVTPDMHRVHHSTIVRETDSNYGFFLPWWDRLFGTYIDQPKHGHDDMDIGIAEWQDERPTKIGWSLIIPFIKQRKK